jgi:hypothetical protein
MPYRSTKAMELVCGASVVAESVYISVVHAENTVLLEKLLCNVARPYAVRWELIMHTAERDEVYSVINNDTIRNKISTLGLTNHTGTDFPLFHWEALNRASFHSTSEQSLVVILVGSVALKEITFYALSIPQLWHSRCALQSC